MTLRTLKVCYFPGRESSYVRNRVLINGMRNAGLKVYDCSYHKKTKLRYLIGFAKFLCSKHKCDVVFIGFFGQFLVPIVRLFTRKKILFDAFLSAYQTLAFDRKAINPTGIKACIVRNIEKKACQLADISLLDTNAHINYFVKEYALDRKKFQRSFLGANDVELCQKTKSDDHKFLVHFHGEFQALHGTEYIVKAAHLLPDVKFRLIGGGKGLNKCKELVNELNISNIEFIPSVKFDLIPNYIAEASVCLGIFGNTQKAQLVIPFKVYEALAMAKPIITADTPAIRELLTPQEDISLCDAANPESLAAAIDTLRMDQTLRNKIAENGYKTFKEKCSPQAIGHDILKIIENLAQTN